MEIGIDDRDRQLGIDDRDGHQVEIHLPWATGFCGIVGGIRLAGAAILTEPAIVTTRKNTCTATSYGR